MAKPKKNKPKTETDPKKQRDKFLAFAFASSDLFIEIGPNDKIIFVLGAVKALTGFDEQSLIGKKWLELFEKDERKLCKKLKKESIPGLRCGPILIDLNKKISKNKAILTAIKMPGTKNYYITLSFNNPLMDKLSKLVDEEGALPLTTNLKPEDEKIETLETGFKATDEATADAVTTDFDAKDEAAAEAITTGFKAKDEAATEAVTTGFDATDDDAPETITTGFEATDDDAPEVLTTGFKAGDGDEDEEFDDSIYNKADFVDEAEAIFEIARTQEIETALTVFDFSKSETITEENWAEAMKKISSLLRKESIGGNAAAEISEGQYSLIHDNAKDSAAIADKIAALCKEYDPNGNGIEIESKTLKTDLEDLSDHEAARALHHTMSAFEEHGAKFDVDGLSSGFSTLVKSNEEKLKEFKSIIERVDFEIVFQPVMNLKTKEADHYETLSRFRQGEIQEWIKFGEDVGLSGDFDLAVVERTFNYVHYKAATTRTKFSINISGKSIEQKNFAERLDEQLSKRNLSDRVLLEITDSAHIQNLQKVIDFINKFRKQGYRIALDDFSLAPGPLKYLRQLPVNFVKLDEKYTSRLTSSEKTVTGLNKLIKACKELNIEIIAECVENQEQADMLADVGITYAQGHLYGKPASNPNFTPPAK